MHLEGDAAAHFGNPIPSIKLLALGLQRLHLSHAPCLSSIMNRAGHRKYAIENQHYSSRLIRVRKQNLSYRAHKFEITI